MSRAAQSVNLLLIRILMDVNEQSAKQKRKVLYEEKKSNEGNFLNFYGFGLVILLILLNSLFMLQLRRNA